MRDSSSVTLACVKLTNYLFCVCPVTKYQGFCLFVCFTDSQGPQSTRGMALPFPKLPPLTVRGNRGVDSRDFAEMTFSLPTGILTLKKANELLSSTGKPGSFLIRVSEKIKGYALSYLSEEEGCKHFLIDASTDSYSFLGVDQLQHATLADLVEYHKVKPLMYLYIK